MSLYLTNSQRFGGAPAPEGLPLGAWTELDRTTLGSAGDTITVSGLDNKLYYMFLVHAIDTGGTIGVAYTFNNDSATNYSRRNSISDGGDVTGVNQSIITNTNDRSANFFGVWNVYNNINEEKLSLGDHCGEEGAGAGIDPQRGENIGKWDNLVDVINRIDIINNTGTGSFDTNSEVVVLGYDPTDTHETTQSFWQPLAYAENQGVSNNLLISFTSKKYLWIQIHMKQISGTMIPEITFNGDHATNYCRSINLNGSADTTTDINENHFRPAGTSSSDSRIIDIYGVNVTGQEKLFYFHTVNVGAAGVVSQRTEGVGKWVKTTDPINQMELFNSGTSDMDDSSYIQIWGAN